MKLYFRYAICVTADVVAQYVLSAGKMDSGQSRTSDQTVFIGELRPDTFNCGDE